MKKIIKFILFAFFAWRVWLEVFLYLGWFTMPLGENFLAGGNHLFEHLGLWPWANFDGEHYLAIAQHGYGNFEQAFFPFFPFLIKFFAFVPKDNLFLFLLSGLAIANISFLFALLFLYLLVKLDFDDKVAQRTIFFLLLFPTSFFFGSVYTESLFLLFVLVSFYSARKKAWLIAGLFGAMASATKVVGIFLFPALLWEWWEQNKNLKAQILNLKTLLTIIPILFIPTGLLSYMHSLAVNYQDPFLFIKVQSAFGAQRVTDKAILLYQVFWRYGKMILTTRIDPLYFTVWLELIVAVLFAVLLAFVYFKKVRLSYLLFAAMAYFAPTLTGTLSSMPRYVLILFPCFMVLALIENKTFRYVFWGLSMILLFLCTVFFTRGYFVG